MTISASRTFETEEGQALWLPDDVAFGRETDVTIVRSGDVLTIYPTRSSIADLMARLETLPGPDAVEVRDQDIMPERPGL